LATGAAFIGLARRRLDRSVLNLDGRGGGGGEELAKRRSRTARAGLSCSAMARVLVVDDEPAVRGALERALRLDAYDVALAADGREALDLLAAVQHDVVVLDLSMPHVDGLEVCRRLRAVGDRTPVLMLTARDAVDDRVAGLDAGADDYLVKPFALKELKARLRALLRRAEDGGAAGDVLRFADLSLDAAAYEVRRGARLVEVTRTEFQLLQLFLEHPRQVLTRSQIFERVWGYDFGATSNALGVYMGYLRRKTEAGGEPRLLHTVRGVGYVLREE
jgi:two-component system, OmpR family, response regulator MprA